MLYDKSRLILEYFVGMPHIQMYVLLQTTLTGGDRGRHEDSPLVGHNDQQQVTIICSFGLRVVAQLTPSAHVTPLQKVLS